MNTLSKKTVTTLVLMFLSSVSVLQAEDDIVNEKSVQLSSSRIQAVETVAHPQNESEVEFETSQGIHIIDSDGIRIESINGKSVREIEQDELDIKNKALEDERVAEEIRIKEEERIAKEQEDAYNLANLSNEEIAKMVLNGDFGNGEERISNVEKAGHNYQEIKSQVAKINQEREEIKKKVAKEVKPASKVDKEQKTEQAKDSSSEPKSTSSDNTSGRTTTMSATGYSTSQPNLSQFTANGTDLLKNPRVVAVDPSVIPLGTVVEIEGYGRYVASDTGGAIKGSRIDIHFPTVSEATSFGRREVLITIVN